MRTPSKRKKMYTAALAAMFAVPTIVSPSAQVEASETASVKAGTFKDVPTSHYAYTEIMNLSSQGVINGFTDGTFRSTKELTRAEFAAFVARALDLPAAESNFKDVSKGMALYDGISRANKAGIIYGFKDGTFKPNVKVTRNDMAVMLDRALQTTGKFTEEKALDFKDNAKVSAYARTSVKRMYYYGIMGALTGNSFKGEAVGDRGTTAKSIYNMLAVKDVGIMPPVKPEPPVEEKPEPPKPPTGEPAIGDKAIVNGFTFTFGGTMRWIDETGYTYGADYPKVDNKTNITITNGRKIPINTQTDTRIMSSAISLVFNFGRDESKDEILKAINQVRSTKKPVALKNGSIEINPYYPKDSSAELHYLVK